MYRFAIRHLLWLILAAGLTFSAAVAEEPSKTQFDFDVSTIPPRPEGKEVVARVFDRHITLKDLNARSAPLDDDAISALQGAILGDLLDWLVKTEKIQVTPEEVQTFYRVVLRKELPAEAVRGDLEKNPKGSVGAHFVKGWKTSKLLYQRYGGTVIFQQGNPREPVGAYRKLLEEAAQAKVFEIHDPADRAAFWKYFTREHPGVVPPEDVDYERPWWLQKPDE